MEVEANFCDLCKLSFSSEQEFKEHNWSMLHHMKLAQTKGRNYTHKCSLCEEHLFGLLAFTSHIHSEKHQNKLSKWKYKSTDQTSVTSSMSSTETRRVPTRRFSQRQQDASCYKWANSRSSDINQSGHYPLSKPPRFQRAFLHRPPFFNAPQAYWENNNTSRFNQFRFPPPLISTLVSNTNQYRPSNSLNNPKHSETHSRLCSGVSVSHLDSVKLSSSNSENKSGVKCSPSTKSSLRHDNKVNNSEDTEELLKDNSYIATRSEEVKDSSSCDANKPTDQSFQDDLPLHLQNVLQRSEALVQSIRKRRKLGTQKEKVINGCIEEPSRGNEINTVKTCESVTAPKFSKPTNTEKVSDRDLKNNALIDRCIPNVLCKDTPALPSMDYNPSQSVGTASERNTDSATEDSTVSSSSDKKKRGKQRKISPSKSHCALKGKESNKKTIKSAMFPAADQVGQDEPTIATTSLTTPIGAKTSTSTCAVQSLSTTISTVSSLEATVALSTCGPGLVPVVHSPSNVTICEEENVNHTCQFKQKNGSFCDVVAGERFCQYHKRVVEAVEMYITEKVMAGTPAPLDAVSLIESYDASSQESSPCQNNGKDQAKRKRSLSDSLDISCVTTGSSVDLSRFKNYQQKSFLSKNRQRCSTSQSSDTSDCSSPTKPVKVSRFKHLKSISSVNSYSTDIAKLKQLPVSVRKFLDKKQNQAAYTEPNISRDRSNGSLVDSESRVNDTAFAQLSVEGRKSYDLQKQKAISNKHLVTDRVDKSISGSTNHSLQANKMVATESNSKAVTSRTGQSLCDRRTDVAINSASLHPQVSRSTRKTALATAESFVAISLPPKTTISTSRSQSLHTQTVSSLSLLSGDSLVLSEFSNSNPSKNVPCSSHSFSSSPSSVARCTNGNDAFDSKISETTNKNSFNKLVASSASTPINEQLSRSTTNLYTNASKCDTSSVSTSSVSSASVTKLFDTGIKLSQRPSQGFVSVSVDIGNSESCRQVLVYKKSSTPKHNLAILQNSDKRHESTSNVTNKTNFDHTSSSSDSSKILILKPPSCLSQMVLQDDTLSEKNDIAKDASQLPNVDEDMEIVVETEMEHTTGYHDLKELGSTGPQEKLASLLEEELLLKTKLSSTLPRIDELLKLIEELKKETVSYSTRLKNIKSEKKKLQCNVQSVEGFSTERMDSPILFTSSSDIVSDSQGKSISKGIPETSAYETALCSLKTSNINETADAESPAFLDGTIDANVTDFSFDSDTEYVSTTEVAKANSYSLFSTVVNCQENSEGNSNKYTSKESSEDTNQSVKTDKENGKHTEDKFLGIERSLENLNAPVTCMEVDDDFIFVATWNPSGLIVCHIKVAQSTKGKILYTGTQSGVVYGFTFHTWTLEQKFVFGNGEILSLHFDFNVLFVGFVNGTIQQIFSKENRTGKVFQRMGRKRRGISYMTSTSTDGVNILYTGTKHGKVYVWSTDGNLINIINHGLRTQVISKMKVLKGLLYVVTNSRIISGYHVKTGALLRTINVNAYFLKCIHHDFSENLLFSIDHYHAIRGYDIVNEKSVVFVKTKVQEKNRNPLFIKYYRGKLFIITQNGSIKEVSVDSQFDLYASRNDFAKKYPFLKKLKSGVKATKAGCECCGSSFSSSAKLRRHQEFYTCKICNQCFRYGNGGAGIVSKHVELFHS